MSFDSDSSEEEGFCSEDQTKYAQELKSGDSMVCSESLSTDMSKTEMFKLIWAMKTSDSMEQDREWLMKAQTFFLFHFSQEKGLDAARLDMLLYSLSASASSLSDSQFFKLTKALASLCVFSGKEHLENVDPNILYSYYLKGLFYCYGLTHGYLKGTYVNTIEVNGEELLQMVPSFTEASLKWLLSLISPSTLVDPDHLRQLIDLIQTNQLSITLVQEEIIKNSSSHLILDSLQKSVKRRSDKCLEDIIKELSQSKLLSNGMLMKIMECLSSQELEYTQKPSSREARAEALVEAKEALIQIANKTTSAVVHNLTLAVRYLSHVVYESKQYKPRLTQLISLCILLLSHKKGKKRVLEVLTGEGKSCIIAMFAAALGMQGKKVDIVTSSPVLAKRDAANWAKFYEMFELTATHNTDTMELLTSEQSKADKTKREGVYGCHIVYGTVSSFSADILREEFEMRNVRGSRGFQAVIIDEVDMLMMDEGIQFTYLSHRVALLRHIEPVLALVWSAVQHHSPLVTEDYDVLFAEVAKNFHSVILDGIDMSEFPELEKDLDHIHQLSDPDKKTAILSLVEKINASGASSIKAYILHEDSTLISASEDAIEDEHISVLVSDNGRVHQLYTQEELTEGVKGLVLSQCDILKQEILHTTEGAVHLPGNPGEFDKVLSNFDSSCQRAMFTLLPGIAQRNIKGVLESMDEKTRMMALEDVTIQDMLSFFKQLNLDFDVIAYTQDENGKLRQSTSCSKEGKETRRKISVLLKDKGTLCPLYTLNEANTNQEDVLFTQDGATFNRGAPDFLDKVVYPLQLLRLYSRTSYCTRQSFEGLEC